MFLWVIDPSLDRNCQPQTRQNHEGDVRQEVEHGDDQGGFLQGDAAAAAVEQRHLPQSGNSRSYNR